MFSFLFMLLLVPIVLVLFFALFLVLKVLNVFRRAKENITGGAKENTDAFDEHSRTEDSSISRSEAGARRLRNFKNEAEEVEFEESVESND